MKRLMDVLIKKLTPNSINMIVNLFLEDNDNTTGIDDSWSESEILSFLNDDSNVCLGAYYKDILIGFVLSYFGRGINKIYVENIYVKNKYRRKGIAKQLIANMQELYSEKGNFRYVALIYTNNIASIKLFSSAGYLEGRKMIWFQKRKEKRIG